MDFKLKENIWCVLSLLCSIQVGCKSNCLIFQDLSIPGAKALHVHKEDEQGTYLRNLSRVKLCFGILALSENMCSICIMLVR